MSTARRYLPSYTIDDYAQWQGDWELWDGVPVAMTPSPFGPHQAASLRLARQIGSQLDGCGCACEVLHEIDWPISNNTVVRPDLVVVCDGVPERHLETTPVLIAEILSASTEQKDRTAKYELYESKAVQFYLLVDLAKLAVEAFFLDSGKYRSIASAPTLELELLSGCRITISPASIF